MTYNIYGIQLHKNIHGSLILTNFNYVDGQIDKIVYDNCARFPDILNMDQVCEKRMHKW